MQTNHNKNHLPICLLLLLTIIVFSQCQKSIEQTAIHPDFVPDSVESYYNGYRLFFLRHIDTLYNDTLYSVCYLGPGGDTIRARVPLIYDQPDTTIWVNFYLRNNGDTLIYDNHFELAPDSLPNHPGEPFQALSVPPADTSLSNTITQKEKAVISEIQQYLEDYQLIEKQKQHEVFIEQL